MSDDNQVAGDATQAQQVNVIAQPRPSEVAAAAAPQSLRHVNEPCAKHAEKIPGEQSWNADGSKKRDPNGFDHSCDDCWDNAHIVVEG